LRQGEQSSKDMGKTYEVEPTIKGNDATLANQIYHNVIIH